MPVAYCAARNTTPSVAFVRPVALFVIVSSRSINSLIWALMLVTIIGPGVFAGILAIGLRSIGFCAKLLYEAIEEIDEGQVEAVRATGASGAQVTAYGIVPQVMPAFAGISVFRWDINIRESTVLGLVGAGGIGLPLNAAITHAGLDAGVADPAGHHRHRGGERMGVRQGAARDHLIGVDGSLGQRASRAPRRSRRSVVTGLEYFISSAVSARMSRCLHGAGELGDRAGVDVASTRSSWPRRPIGAERAVSLGAEHPRLRSR